jgi:hypothetical protein
MHISLDQAIGRQPRLNRVGQSLLNIASGASAAYSLRSLTGDEPKAVRIRRDGDNEERDFTTAEIGNEAADWTNGKQETTLPADLPSTSSSITGFTVSGTDAEFNSTFTLFGSQSNGKNQYVHSSESTRKIRYRSDGKWELDQDGDQYQVSVDVGRDYPWDVVDWVQGPEGSGGDPVFSSFVGGNPDNSPAAAYSLRKVRSTYTGPAVRIRRESDDVEVNVSFDTNDEVSTSSPIENTTEQGGESGSTTATTLGEFISGTNAAVHTWYDQSGNSKNATQEADANQPLIAEGGVLHTDDGKPALKFNGTSHRLELSAKATIANTSIFSAFRSNSNTQDSVLFHLAVDAGNAVSIGFGDLATRTELGSRLRVGGSNLVSVGDNTFTSTSQSLLSYIASSSAAKMFVDSTEETDSVAARTSGPNNRIGARGDDDKFFNGDISEVILFDSDQTNNRFKIESNINNHYTIYTAAQNGFVNKWYDQSGNSNDATVAADTNEPKIVSAGSLLADGITFDGTNDFLETSQSVITQSSAGSFSYFGVSTIATDEAGYIFGSAGNNSALGSSLYAQDVSKFSLSNGNNAARDNITRSSGENLLSACYTGGRANLRVNGGGTSVAAGTYSFNANANFTIGNRESGSSAATFLAGSIKEIIAYDSDQTSNRTAIETNIANEYGITLS